MAHDMFVRTPPPAIAPGGDRGALDKAFETFYPELRRIAHGRLCAWRRHDGALDTTMLVHETFLRLASTPHPVLNDRKHFYTYAAKTMRNIIIDFTRGRLAARRGAGIDPSSLDDDLFDDAGASADTAALIRINDALLALEAVDAELARVVELRFFVGHSEAEIAALLGTCERTVRRQWRKARAFLLAALCE